MIQWLVLVTLVLVLWYFIFKRNIHVKEEDAATHAMDIFKLHPGTKVLWDDDFEGYLLPNGKVVMYRYWKRLEGVTADY